MVEILLQRKMLSFISVEDYISISDALKHWQVKNPQEKQVSIKSHDSFIHMAKIPEGNYP